VDEVTTPDFILHFLDRGYIGLDEFKESISWMLEASPDFHITMDEVLFEADKAAYRYTLTATHKGEFMGIPPTNKRFSISGFGIAHYKDGKQTEAWGMTDALGMMQQLGAIPIRNSY
jgi:predicted ester cyclase